MRESRYKHLLRSDASIHCPGRQPKLISEINLLEKKWLFWLMVLEASVHGLLALLVRTRIRSERSYLSHGIQETKKEEDDLTSSHKASPNSIMAKLDLTHGPLGDTIIALALSCSTLSLAPAWKLGSDQFHTILSLPQTYSSYDRG